MLHSVAEGFIACPHHHMSELSADVLHFHKADDFEVGFSWPYGRPQFCLIPYTTGPLRPSNNVGISLQMDQINPFFLLESTFSDAIIINSETQLLNGPLTRNLLEWLNIWDMTQKKSHKDIFLCGFAELHRGTQCETIVITMFHHSLYGGFWFRPV